MCTKSIWNLTQYFILSFSIWKGLEWIKNPKRLNETNIFRCQSFLNQAPCPEPQICTYNDSVPGGARRMGSCTPCPAEYPWLDKFEGTLTSETNLIPVVPTVPFSSSDAINNWSHGWQLILATSLLFSLFPHSLLISWLNLNFLLIFSLKCFFVAFYPS